MRAAIYARKSTDEGDTAAEAKSTNRQIEHARKFIAGQGWTLADEHVFEDDGVSGAEFKNRHGLLRMLNAGKDFDVLVMSEMSRLGRDQVLTSKCLADLHAAKVEVWLYMTKEKVKFDSATDRFMVNVQNFAADIEREKAALRARDKFLEGAHAGRVTGGDCYGYTRVRMGPPSKNRDWSWVEYRINDAEADVVRRVFEMYAEGHGYDTIAKTLNNDPRYWQLNKKYFGGRRIPSPKAGKRHTGTWAVTALHEMLKRERYIGVLVYGRFRSVMNNGTAGRVKTDPSDWVRKENPALRIVLEPVWDAVQAKLLSHQGNLGGRGGRVGESRWLLSGIARCGVCTASMAILAGKRRRYGCSYHRQRGITACSNDLEISAKELEKVVIDAVQETVMKPEVLQRVVGKVWQRLRAAPKGSDPSRAELERNVRDIEKRLKNLTDALAGGRDKPSVVLQSIRQHETQLRTLKGQQAELSAVSTATTGNELALRRHVERAVKEWRERLAQDVPTARLALRTLLVDGRLTAKPVKRQGQMVYAVEGSTAVAALLAGTQASQVARGELTMASPRGFEPRLPP